MAEDPRRTRAREIVSALPEVEEEQRAGNHVGFLVRGKRFAYYLDDHHGDGRIAFQCKMPPGEMGRMVESDPGKYFAPAYMARHGWVGIYLDAGEVDWGEIEALAGVAWSLVTPGRLRRRVKGGA